MSSMAALTTYWDGVASRYQRHTRISTVDFHYGPLLEGDRAYRLLPSPLAGCRCLEAGCGAGQNSIVLARAGARCLAIDASVRQIALGRPLAQRCRVSVDYRVQTLESLPDAALGAFDLVHSVHALAFVSDPRAVLQGMIRMLKPGGTLLVATSHPLAGVEPVRLTGRRVAGLIDDYFQPVPDIRGGRGGRPSVCARAMPLGDLIDTVAGAGCRIERVLEPSPPPIPDMSEATIRRRIPYESRSWRGRYPLLAIIPFTVIMRARRDD